MPRPFLCALWLAAAPACSPAPHCRARGLHRQRWSSARSARRLSPQTTSRAIRRRPEVAERPMISTRAPKGPRPGGHAGGNESASLLERSAQLAGRFRARAAGPAGRSGHRRGPIPWTPRQAHRTGSGRGPGTRTRRSTKWRTHPTERVRVGQRSGRARLVDRAGAGASSGWVERLPRVPAPEIPELPAAQPRAGRRRHYDIQPSDYKPPQTVGQPPPEHHPRAGPSTGRHHHQHESTTSRVASRFDEQLATTNRVADLAISARRAGLGGHAAAAQLLGSEPAETA